MKLRSTFGPLVLAVGLAAAVSVTFALQDSPQHKILFERATFTMETKGDLQGAIALFEEIIRKYPNEREYAAAALLQIGLCYEKLGLEKAQDAYQRLIKDYAGQTASVAAARERLDNLLRAASSPKKGEGDLTIRRIPTPKGIALTEAVSPNGKYLADIAENECDLRVTEILTGKQRNLTTKDKECSWGPRWSPDSTKLAVTTARALRVVALDGSGSRVLLDAGVDGWIDVLDWSPDQKYILVRLSTERPKYHGLSLVAVADGSVRSLKDLDDSTAPIPPFDCRFSPDGLTIAYSRPTSQDSRTLDVFLLSADGSRDTPLIQHPAQDAFLEWLPDGRSILFSSNRAGTVDLWSVRIEKGQPQGAPTLVRRSIGPLTPMRLTQGGAFYYQTPGSLTDVYTIRLDPKTGTIAGPPRKEPLPYEGHNRWPDWSPDGKRLAYVSLRPTIVGPFLPGRAREPVVAIYSADTGKVREYPQERPFLNPRWSPDGRHLYLQASNVGGRGIYRMDVESGEVTPFLGAGEKKVVMGVQSSPDGKWIVYARDGTGVLCRDARTGEEKELDGSPYRPGVLALSRDGSRLAWVTSDGKEKSALKVMPFPDGTPKQIQQFLDSGNSIAWSPDGRFIYYSDVPPSGGRDWHLWRIPADGGDAQDLGLIDEGGLSVHPDGSRITFFTSTLNPEPAQIWVMENFLPLANEAASVPAQKTKK